MRYQTGRRAMVVFAIAVTLLSGPTAAGATKPGGYRPSTLIIEDCGPAASTCDASASATREGAHRADAMVEVPEPTAEPQHWGISLANGATTTQLVAPARSVTLTFKWHVDEASSSAEAAFGEGVAVGRIFLRGTVTHQSCSGCVVEDATAGHGAVIADSYDRGINPLPTTATHPPGEVSHRVVLRGSGGATVPAGKLSLIWATKAVAYVGCPVEGAECVPGVVPDPTYGGSATSHAKTQLLSITVSSSP